MKTWEHIEISDEVGYGITEEGYGFAETDIIGYNDDEDFRDLETLITIRYVPDTGVETVQFHFDELKNNVTVFRLLKEAKKDLKKHG